VFLLDEVQQFCLHAGCLKKLPFKLFMRFIFGDAGLICVCYLTLRLIVPSHFVSYFLGLMIIMFTNSLSTRHFILFSAYLIMLSSIADCKIHLGRLHLKDDTPHVI
jgi:hypothetical protein